MIKVAIQNKADRLLFAGLRQIAEVLGPKAENRVMRRALKAAGAEILKRAKQLAPRSKHGSRWDRPPGNLRRSLAVTRGRRIRKYRHNIIAVLGPAWPLGAHGHLVEKGTERRQTRQGWSRGIMPATPFLEPAFEGKRAEAMARLRAELNRGIKREFDRYLRKVLGG